MQRWLGLHIVNHRTLSNREVLDCIDVAEHLGLDGVTLNEDVGHDAFAVLSVAAQRTQRIILGTAITNVYFRTPMQIAMGAVTLDDLSGGRAQLGLSVGHHPWNDLMHGVPMEAPLARLRESVGFIRKAITGEPFEHDGPRFRGIRARMDQVPVRRQLPLHICGEGPRILALAGEVADGAIVNISTPAYLRSVATTQLQAGAARAGRDGSRIELTSIVTCCLEDDRQQALRHARMAFVERLRGSGKHLARARSEAEVQQITALRELVLRGETEQAIATAPEELVTSLIATGSADDVWSMLEQHYAAGCTRVAIAPFPRTHATVTHTLRALAARIPA